MPGLFLRALATLTLLLVLPVLALAQEKTVQGRTVEFDKAKNTVTLIKDSKNDPANPEYAELPPQVFALAPGAAPEPKAGGRMKLDAKTNKIIIYDPAAKAFKTIDYILVEQKEGVAPEDPAVADKKFPAVDKARKTVTIYSKRQKILTTFTPPDQYLDLPVATWDSGDEVRITYVEPGKAAKYENLSRK